MKVNKSPWRVGMGLLVLAVAPSVTLAQGGGFGAGFGPPLKAVPPPREFSTSEEHYAYLLQQAKGGTKHTIQSVPRWDGLWNTAGNTHMEVFIDGQGFQGKVREGVLKPAYEAAFKERWREQQELGQVNYDRLTHCEPQGMPRFLLEPYTHEFINLPQQSYQINDFANSVRRVYIGHEHNNLTGSNSWYGDTIGFWDGDKLVTNTVDLLPADFTRWSPMTSNQFETVEIWELKKYPDGLERLEVQVTMYDSHAFVKPVNIVYAFRHGTALEKAGLHVQYWECEETSNSYLDENGTTNFRLPGEEGYKDGRRTTMFPHLPGQTRDSINDGAELGN
jgi:hypothetical protein